MKNLLPFPNNTVSNILKNAIVAIVVAFIAVSVTALILNVITSPEAFNVLR
jgi:hypothetical protein